ncbi:MAG: CehA/McbA family metallohydrolase [Actinomycetota bacterium]|nr:CehA/McbA family metallohydrolase [Actinomycetota bacterium]
MGWGLEVVFAIRVLVVSAFGLAAIGTGIASAHDASITEGTEFAQRSSEAGAAGISGCSGAPMPNPDQVISGEFNSEIEKSNVLVPFVVPAQIDAAPVTAVRVKYCFDQPELPTDALFKNVLDLGIYEPRTDTGSPWGPAEFRGWGGSSHPDVTLSSEGFEVDDGGTTKAFLPGPIPAGEWAVELGVAAVATPLEGNLDDEVAWRIEIDLLTDPAFADEPYATTPCADGGICDYNESPANAEQGWYAGDFHVHGDHSARQDAPMREVFNYAFCPDDDLGSLCEESDAQPGADLDFITLSDYVGGSSWGEIGRFQADYPGKLVIRSAEVITYRGHANNHGIAEQADYRTGPLYVRSANGTLALARGPRPASELFDFVHAEGGFTQINHPTIFPTLVPGFDFLCRGCPWDYSDSETDYSKVDAVEIATGPAGLKQVTQPGPNPFTLTAIKFWEDAIDSGGANSNKIAAVGSSDSHNAGRVNDPITQAPIGQATTVVRADELSEEGIEAGVKAGHTYVKMWGNDGPDLRLTATVPGSADPPAIMGDTVEANGATFDATVKNLDEARAARPGQYTLFLYRNSQPFLSVPLPPSGDSFEFSFPDLGSARYRLQVQRLVAGTASIEAVSSPIYLEPAPGEPPPPPGDCTTNLRGTDGDDRFTGTPGSDSFRGGRGADRMKGAGGDDCLRGGGGRDRIGGGPGEDELRGGPGADRIRAADGAPDQVNCGRGKRDRARVDETDRVNTNCEKVFA